MNYISLCAIVKNETPYLLEWCAFNKIIGIEHIYIFDNESDISARDTLKYYIEAGFVDVIDFPGVAKQMEAYNFAIRTFGHKTKWLAIVDADEFLVPKSTNSISEILQNYEDFGGLAVSWRIFGSNNHIEKPNGLIIENYTTAMPRDDYENSHIKSIIQPERTIRDIGNPHAFIYKSGYFAVSENKEIVPNAWSKHSADKIQLNHYFTKSFEEFKIKIQRPRADTTRYGGRVLEDFYKFNDKCVEYDDCALRFIDELKKELI
jgi:hypothetical protein